ncbi:hypothetical protein NAP1_10238 [Erythrobacter sp. NAP1]|nr:hypothetical protein NAP1_10238 [Erythrobacter sp. NAP1]
MSRQAAYPLRARAPGFAKFWDLAMEEAAQRRASARKPKRVHPLLSRAPVDLAAGAMREDDSYAPHG